MGQLQRIPFSIILSMSTQPIHGTVLAGTNKNLLDTSSPLNPIPQYKSPIQASPFNLFALAHTSTQKMFLAAPQSWHDQRSKGAWTTTTPLELQLHHFHSLLFSFILSPTTQHKPTLLLPTTTTQPHKHQPLSHVTTFTLVYDSSSTFICI